MKNFLILCGLLASAAQLASASSNAFPRIEELCTVSPDIISFRIVEGKVHYRRQTPYRAQPGDTQTVWKTYGSLFLTRNGRDIGALVGLQADVLKPFDQLESVHMEPALLDAPDSYTLRSASDVNYKTAQHPIAVYRKTRPVDMVRTGHRGFNALVEHRIYLKLSQALKGARPYELGFADKRLSQRFWQHDPFNTVSEAIHVSQIGFRPEDAVKVAFLSIWLGNGGAHTFPPNLPFRLINNEDERTVYVGTVAKRTSFAAYPEDPSEQNGAQTDVNILDFSSFRSPGSYRLFVDGIGCSPAITIASNVWETAFVKSAQGLTHQRSGIAFDPRWADDERPRPFHSDDGLRVFHSAGTLMNSAQGLNAEGLDQSRGFLLNAGRTEQVVSNAWGGYFDAGDWDRRIQHLDVARLLLELFELQPSYFSALALKLPEQGGALPDIIDEALWGIDFFRRMQEPDGGIRGGIDTAAHPRFGEASWQNSLPTMAYAPDLWSSYLYAGVAARAARCLMLLNDPLAATYLDSALRAMAYAESQFPTKLAKPSKLPTAVHDARNLAAVELFAITGAEKWNALFLATTAFKKSNAPTSLPDVYDQMHAAFLYARTDWHGTRKKVSRNARQAILTAAEASEEMTRTTGFGWTQNTPWQPIGYGVLSTPQALGLVRAHVLSSHPAFLKAVLMACQTGAGANPLNLCYTTGVGHRWPANPLCIDARVSGLNAPTGITVYGPLDAAQFGNNWAFDSIRKYLYPDLGFWPLMESYFDVFMFPAMCEFAVHETIALNAYVWGYLASLHH
ncbi:MAG: glycoside hydrolase family 9 protein [Verrucomicrobia bacterium]|nr:glycoside hydrolase family 9 protein [Verrucomicrobiota bacterium]